jgi:hypothetical protein
MVLTGLTGVGQWTRGLVFRCVLGSEGCVLVPRSSGTHVATWTWPTWVVSRRRVLEAVFILLEFPSPSRRIFIGSHSLPPSLLRRIGPSSRVLSCCFTIILRLASGLKSNLAFSRPSRKRMTMLQLLINKLRLYRFLLQSQRD